MQQVLILDSFLCLILYTYVKNNTFKVYLSVQARPISWNASDDQMPRELFGNVYLAGQCGTVETAPDSVYGVGCIDDQAATNGNDYALEIP